MPQLGRNGSIVLNLLAGQSLTVGSFGPGNYKISQAAFINSSIPPVYSVQVQSTGGYTYLTYAVATNVLIEAANGCELEYAYGLQPSLTYMPFGAVTNITAKAGGTQALGTPLNAAINRVSVCATAGDSVLLPVADIVGKTVNVFNAGAASMNVFGQVGDAIGGGATNAAFAIPSGKGARFDVVVNNSGGQAFWNVVLSA